MTTMLRSRPVTSTLRVALVLALLAVSSCQSAASDTVLLEPATGKTVPVAVELATTPDERQLGLMYRESLDPGRGMLFIFPHAAPQSFWMKNTKIPLDILFIDDAGKIVRLHARTTPFSEASLPSDAPVRFVLEVPGGYSAGVGLREGDTVHLGDLVNHPVR